MSRKLTLFLYVKGKEIKRILQIPNFEEAVTIQLIQSINGYQESLFESRIDVNSSNQNETPVKDEDFEANINGIINDLNEYEDEVKVQKEIENEFEEQIEAENEKGRQRAARLQAEERARLVEMKKAEEEKKLKKQTTVSVKAKTK